VLAAVVAAVAALGVGAVGWSVVLPLFGPAFAEAAHLLVPLVVAEIALAPYLVASRGVLGRGGTVSAALLGVAAGGAAVLGYVLGAAAGGTLGLAVACVAVYGVLSLAATGTFLWEYRRRPDRHRLRARSDLAEGPVRS
jgi:O-antigen/teichoic acid export membrane protein